MFSDRIIILVQLFSYQGLQTQMISNQRPVDFQIWEKSDLDPVYIWNEV